MAILTALYRDALKWFYGVKGPLAGVTYEQHKHSVDENVSLWAAAWERALTKKGFDVLTFPLNDHQLLQAWAIGHGVRTDTSQSILVEMMRQFKPDILWFDSVDAALLRSLKNALPALRLVFSWSGSAVVAFDVFKESNAVLTCAPETVTRLKADGFNVHHFNHAFDPVWTQGIHGGEKLYDVTFVGQIVRGASFHVERERMLRQLAQEVDLALFSPTYEMGPADVIKTVAVQAAYLILLPLKNAGLSSQLSKWSAIKKVLGLTAMPGFPYDRSLKRIARPAVFGTGMLERLHQSRMVLNIHADTSPHFASNMRLFETTGVGSLLLTEARANMGELFQPDVEVATYTSVDDCLEKVRWLTAHPGELGEIAERGRRRTLKDHTFDQRADILCEIIGKYLHG